MSNTELIYGYHDAKGGNAVSIAAKANLLERDIKQSERVGDRSKKDAAKLYKQIQESFLKAKKEKKAKNVPVHIKRANNDLTKLEKEVNKVIEAYNSATKKYNEIKNLIGKKPLESSVNKSKSNSRVAYNSLISYKNEAVKFKNEAVKLISQMETYTKSLLTFDETDKTYDDNTYDNTTDLYDGNKTQGDTDYSDTDVFDTNTDETVSGTESGTNYKPLIIGGVALVLVVAGVLIYKKMNS